MPDSQMLRGAQSTLDELRTAVSQQMGTYLRDTRSHFLELGAEIDDHFTVTERLTGGGKRLRAAFAAGGWIAYGGASQAEPILLAGAGLELFQVAALVHDDVIDGSTTRRGVPAAHRQFATMHSERAMSGAREHFGQAGAILLGDLLVVMANGQLLDALSQLDPGPAARSRAIVTEMMSEVTLGQYLDIYAQSAPWHPDPGVDLDRAHRVLRSKSARYSVEHPLLLGAAMAGAGPAELAHCRRIGLPIGEAFQLRDDLLGIFGDSAQTGKPTGDDIREGKRTLLMTTAITMATAAQGQELREMLGEPVHASDVDRARVILSECGAVDAIEAMIADRASAAVEEIAAAGWEPEAAQLVRFLAEVATTRSS